MDKRRFDAGIDPDLECSGEAGHWTIFDRFSPDGLLSRRYRFVERQDAEDFADRLEADWQARRAERLETAAACGSIVSDWLDGDDGRDWSPIVAEASTDEGGTDEGGEFPPPDDDDDDDEEVAGTLGDDDGDEDWDDDDIVTLAGAWEPPTPEDEADMEPAGLDVDALISDLDSLDQYQPARPTPRELAAGMLVMVGSTLAWGAIALAAIYLFGGR